MRWRKGAGFAAVLAAAITWLGLQPREARAAYISADERIEAAAFLSTQSTAHHKSTEKIDWVQFRNEFRLDLRYYFLGKFSGPEGDVGTQIYPINRARLSLLYRARYDGVYDIRDHYRKLGYDRDDFRFPEGKLPRELFLDLELQKPLDSLSFRIGKQQVVWGEADLFRSLDVINPLRLDQNGLIGEDFDEYREPLWIAKGLFRVSDVLGDLVHGNTFIEFFYSPNWRPLTDRVIVGEGFRKGVDRNHALNCSTVDCNGDVLNDPQRNGFAYPNFRSFARVRHPWEVSRVGDFRTDAPDYADLGADSTTCADGLGCGDFLYLINNGVPTSTFDLDASMMGVRWFSNFKGVEYTFNYIFKRTEVPGTSLRVDDLFDPAIATDGSPNPRADLLVEGAAAELTPDLNGNGVPDGREQLINDCIYGKQPKVILSAVHGPSIQTKNPITQEPSPNVFTGCELVGFWYPWTHIIGFTATYVDFDYTGFVWRIEQSFSTKEPRNHKPPLANDRAGNFPTADDFETHIKRDTSVWRSMFGFDYLRTIWPHPPMAVRQNPLGSLLYDQWFFTFQFFNEYYSHSNNQIGLLDSVTDRMQKFNPILTYVQTGFFMKDKFRPFIAVGYDINAQFPVTWVQGEYFLGQNNKWSLRLGWIGYLGSRSNESFLFLHKYADRDTLFARLTYYLI
jgi:hypothetical protein